MSDKLKEFVTSIANAIRSKKGTTELINPQNFSSEIESLQSSSVGSSNIGQLVDKSIVSVSAEDLDGIESIGENAFYKCTSLSEITIPEGVISILNSAFYGCSGLSKITIPEGVAVIGNSTFYGCSSLSEITIPASIAHIGTQTFAGNFHGNIKILATNPPVLSNSNAISSNVGVIYIPAGTLSKYQSTTNWSSFSSKFVELEA